MHITNAMNLAHGHEGPVSIRDNFRIVATLKNAFVNYSEQSSAADFYTRDEIADTLVQMISATRYSPAMDEMADMIRTRVMVGLETNSYMLATIKHWDKLPVHECVRTTKDFTKMTHAIIASEISNNCDLGMIVAFHPHHGLGEVSRSHATILPVQFHASKASHLTTSYNQYVSNIITQPQPQHLDKLEASDHAYILSVHTNKEAFNNGASVFSGIYKESLELAEAAISHAVSIGKAKPQLRADGMLYREAHAAGAIMPFYMPELEGIQFSRVFKEAQGKAFSESLDEKMAQRGDTLSIPRPANLYDKICRRLIGTPVP